MGGAYGWGKVVHEEFELALCDTARELLGYGVCRHFRFQVVGGDAGRRDHVADFVFKLLLDTAVEEEGNVSVFLGLGDVALLDSLLGEPLCKNVVHALWGEGDVEGEVGLVLCHGGDVDVLWVGEVWEWGVVDTEELSNFADAIRAVVEEEEGVVVYE